MNGEHSKQPEALSTDQETPTDREIVEWFDPDWRDHFTDTDLAADHYRRYAPAEWQQAIEEMNR